MERLSSTIRIVVLGPQVTDLETRANDTRRALEQLGTDASIVMASDVANFSDDIETETLDLIVLDCDDREANRRLLDQVGSLGPPVLVVLRDDDEETALDAFRCGANQCVRVGDDYVNLLCATALEMIHDWQALRERGKVERRIDELQRYNENIIQNINSALVVVNTAREISFANPTAESVLGVESGKLLGRQIADWFRDEPADENLIVRTLETGAKFKGAESSITREDGRVIPVGVSCSPLTDREGLALGAVAIFQDLSDIKLLERQVLQSEKMASIGQLAAGVAHEINNPVGFIHANLFQVSEYLQDLEGVWERLDLLQETIERGEGLDEVRAASESLRQVCHAIDLDFVKKDFVKAVDESLEGSERIRHIVRDLRDFSRQDTGEATLADVNRCIDSTAHIVWTMMKHHVVLKKNYEELPPLRCYPMQLEQVLMNLLVNACQAIEEKTAGDEIPNALAGGVAGGVTGEVEVQTRARDGGVVITIRDNGVGIPAEDLGRIFDPFFTTKDVGAGTGLGLSTSYSLIQRHGGEISVESEVGKGTTFEIWLPGELEAESREHAS